MKKLIGLVVVVAVLAGARIAYDRWENEIKPKKDAQQRVENMLRGMAGNDEQTAICIWAENKRILDYDLLKRYEPIWLEFWRTSGLGAAKDWKVVAVELEPGEIFPWAKVTVTSGSRTVVLKVPRESSHIELIRGGGGAQ